MKKIFLIVFSIISLLVITSYSIPCNKVKIKVVPPSPITTLDSLQGSWLNEDDTSNKIVINGRQWLELYDTFPPVSHLIFFSDTAIATDSNFIPTFDTTRTSGEFIIFSNSILTQIDCYALNGFYRDMTDTTFAIRPAINWTDRSVIVYKKAH